MNVSETRLRNARALAAAIGGATVLAAKLGAEPARITSLLRGDPRQPIDDPLARAIETCCSKPHGWLDVSHYDLWDHYARAERQRRHHHSESPTAAPGRLPMLSWSQAGAAPEPAAGTQVAPMVETWLIFPFVAASQLYVLRVSGDSMYNPVASKSYQEGDYLIVDPQRNPADQAIVVVRAMLAEQATFRQMLIRDGQRYLLALNPQWPNRLVEVTNQHRLCGVVIGKWVPEES